MNKYELLAALRDRLSGLPQEDIEKSVDYYSEIIDDRIEDGLSEEEAVKAIGSVDEIASQILMETSLPKLVTAKVKPSRSLRAWEIILLILGSPIWLPLCAAALCIILSACIVLLSVVAVLYSLVLSFGICAIAGIIISLFYLLSGNFVLSALLLGAGLFCAGMVILLFFASNQIAKGILVLSKKILFAIKSCFVGKGSAQ